MLKRNRFSFSPIDQLSESDHTPKNYHKQTFTLNLDLKYVHFRQWKTGHFYQLILISY